LFVNDSEIYCNVFLRNQPAVSQLHWYALRWPDTKISTEVFHQLLTIHRLRNGHYVPLAFFLLANKHQTSYEDVFRHRLKHVVWIFF
jgi:hypothetical protein